MAVTKNQIAATLSRAEAAQAGVLGFSSLSEAQTVINANARKLFGFTIKSLPPGFPTEPKIYIYNISEQGEEVNIGAGFPTFKVEACPEGEAYSDPCTVDPVYMPLEAKVDTTEFMPTTGQQVMESILKIGPGMNPSWDRRKLGWFASAHNPPKQQEVEAAIALHTQHCQFLLNQANAYASSGKLLEINETHRRAAKYLGQKVDWSKPLQKMIDCPGCGEMVKSTAIMHANPSCGYVFRWEDAIAAGMKKIEDAPTDVQERLTAPKK